MRGVDAVSRGAEPVRYYADAPNRVAALLIDAVALTIVVFIAAIAVSLILGPAVELDASADSVEDAVKLDRGVAAVDALLALLISAGYFICSWSKRAGTPGQRLIGLRVGSQDDGSPLPAPRAALRWALIGAPFGAVALLTAAVAEVGDAVPDLALAAWYGVLLVSVVRSPTKQGLHDRLARSAVAKLARPVAWERPPPDAR